MSLCRMSCFQGLGLHSQKALVEFLFNYWEKGIWFVFITLDMWATWLRPDPLWTKITENAIRHPNAKPKRSLNLHAFNLVEVFQQQTHIKLKWKSTTLALAPENVLGAFWVDSLSVCRHGSLRPRRRLRAHPLEEAQTGTSFSTRKQGSLRYRPALGGERVYH